MSNGCKGGPADSAASEPDPRCGSAPPLPPEIRTSGAELQNGKSPSASDKTTSALDDEQASEGETRHGSKGSKGSKAASARGGDIRTKFLDDEKASQGEVRNGSKDSKARSLAAVRFSKANGSCLELLRKDLISQRKDNIAHADPESAVQKGSFCDAHAMKEQVRQQLARPVYDITKFYKSKGIWQWLARSKSFDKLVLFMIGANAIWIAVDTDYNQSPILLDSEWYFQFGENVFASFFAFEWLVRLLAFQRLAPALKDFPFLFDTFLIFLMLSETWVFMSYLAATGAVAGTKAQVSDVSLLRIARLLRVSRLVRMAKLLRCAPELLILIKGLVAATRTVSLTIVLLTGAMYMFSIVFSNMSKGTEFGRIYCDSVQATMYFLLVHGTLLQDTDYKAMEMTGRLHVGLTVIWWLWVLFGGVLIMNMLIGELCTVVSAVAATEREELTIKHVRRKLQTAIALIDEDGNGTVSREEFRLILTDIDAMEALMETGVDVVGLVDFADLIFGAEDEDEVVPGGQPKLEDVELSLPEFLGVVLQLRATNQATVKDMVDLRKYVRSKVVKQRQEASQLQVALDDLQMWILKINQAWLADKRERAFYKKCAKHCAGGVQPRSEDTLYKNDFFKKARFKESPARSPDTSPRHAPSPMPWDDDGPKDEAEREATDDSEDAGSRADLQPVRPLGTPLTVTTKTRSADVLLEQVPPQRPESPCLPAEGFPGSPAAIFFKGLDSSRGGGGWEMPTAKMGDEMVTSSPTPSRTASPPGDDTQFSALRGAADDLREDDDVSESV
eukprot:TRINITY_DN35737_c0_g1_i1.p1 TRINITY_DN35737_c0_g1~~TRINITY_DN35737_c0_g1_i1.p1  ORF type:complete len:788 (-),score=227.97 TRINITY_DN35737_c0_g1_i1:215-2578(-)